MAFIPYSLPLYFIDLISPLIILDISSPCFRRLSLCSVLIYLSFSAKYNIDLTSLHDANAIYKNLEKSALELLSNPSAILFEIDMTALQI